MIPKILHQSSKYFTWEERRLAARARALMPEWQYHFWSDEDNLALVEQLRPCNRDEYLKFPTGASRVDVARYLYMYQYGGIYFDTDFRFRKPITQDLLSHECILGVEEENAPELGGGRKIGNAFIGSRPGLALWMDLVESIFACFRKGKRLDDSIFLSGPYALTTFLGHHNQYEKIVTLLPPHAVYPTRTKFYLTAARNPETIGVHLMWGSWRPMSLPHKFKNRVRRMLSAGL
jgi:glycosyl transferase-like sugar-binding protein